MTVAAKSLLIGLLAGVFLAVLAPRFVFQVQLPTLQEGVEPGITSPLSHVDSMAQALKNIAGRGARGYKSLWTAPAATKSSLRYPAPSTISSATHKHATFSTTSAAMSNQKSFFDAVKERRTYYQLNKEAPISDKQITDIVEKAVLHVPSSFNSQSTRLVVLLNKDHETFWEFVLEVLKPLTPEDHFPQTEQKINGFKGAYGTVSRTNAL
jgi:hypothetical protein